MPQEKDDLILRAVARLHRQGLLKPATETHDNLRSDEQSNRAVPPQSAAGPPGHSGLSAQLAPVPVDRLQLNSGSSRNDRLIETERQRSTNEPIADPNAPSPTEKLVFKVLLIAGLAMFVATVISGVLLHRFDSPKEVATGAIAKTHSLPAKKPKIFVAKQPQTFVAEKTLIAPPHLRADHPLATEAGKPSVNPAVRNLLDRGWALVAPPYSLFRWQQAGQDFEQALKIDAGSNEAKTGLAYVLGARLSDQWAPVLQENPRRAEDLLSEVLDKGDTTKRMAEAHFVLGLVYQAQNRLPEAKAEFARSIVLVPNNARALLHIGETLMYMGDPECLSFERVIRLGTQDTNIAAINYWALGTCHLILGDVDQGIAGFRKALAANDRLWVPYFYLAGAYGLKGDLGQAKSALSESLKRKPALKSLTRMRSENPWLDNSSYWALQENTLNQGLRQAGLPDH
jgi:tetratricopeptide (TPR) repeat protein